MLPGSVRPTRIEDWRDGGLRRCDASNAASLQEADEEREKRSRGVGGNHPREGPISAPKGGCPRRLLGRGFFLEANLNRIASTLGAQQSGKERQVTWRFDNQLSIEQRIDLAVSEQRGACPEGRTASRSSTGRCGDSDGGSVTSAVERVSAGSRTDSLRAVDFRAVLCGPDRQSSAARRGASAEGPTLRSPTASS